MNDFKANITKYYVTFEKKIKLLAKISSNRADLFPYHL